MTHLVANCVMLIMFCTRFYPKKLFVEIIFDLTHTYFINSHIETIPGIVLWAIAFGSESK